MIRSRLVQAWCARILRREDPALQRISRLKGYCSERPKTTVPVFFARKATLT
ncbi:hypothetical protein [Tabrizicola sp.]|jgi:hypothetical protein|uniref:hypothetical protein n=1 Tax=Tabrizicola sp. TaxID=2005166 RepID=UPI0025F797DA|nr:hypothetical protein [Tabrizicola sp.]MBY0351775.1 hypothetical protein [Tabrizicola sp.]MDK2775284.1 hypothetical protein [Tabrizicola sp.]